MATTDVSDILRLVPAALRAPQGVMSTHYDAEADVLYVTFKQDGVATESELRDNDIIVRYENEEVIGLTILRASQR